MESKVAGDESEKRFQPVASFCLENRMIQNSFLALKAEYRPRI